LKGDACSDQDKGYCQRTHLHIGRALLSVFRRASGPFVSKDASTHARLWREQAQSKEYPYTKQNQGKDESRQVSYAHKTLTFI